VPVLPQLQPQPLQPALSQLPLPHPPPVPLLPPLLVLVLPPPRDWPAPKC